MNNKKTFWGLRIKDMKRGYIYSPKSKRYSCILCDREYIKGNVYSANSSLVNAKKAMEYHLHTEHEDLFYYYLNMGKIYTGLSEGQTELMKQFYQGFSDKEIMAKSVQLDANG